MSKKSRSRTAEKRDPKTVAFWSFMAVALVAAIGMYWASTARGAEDTDYVSHYTPAPPVEAPVINQAAALQGVRDVIASNDPIVVSVLGDSTGNDGNEWVALWAKDLSASKTVTIHYWKDSKFGVETETFGTGPAVTIWNGSQPGAAASYPIDKLERIQPEKPSVLILNFGHNQGADNAASQQGDVIRAVEFKWGAAIPTATILQNAAVAPRAERSAENVNLVSEWADRSGVPKIDVHAAFVAQPDLTPLIMNDGTGVHPTPQGSRIWADVVSGQLNP